MKISPLPQFSFEKTDGYGKRKKVDLPNSVEAVRSMLLACAIVFARNNKVPPMPRIVVQLTPDIVRDDTDPNDNPEGWGGFCWCDRSLIRCRVYPDFSDTLCIIIHEYIHLLGYDSEWVVSTMTNRVKEEVAQIAAILLSGYYRGAAIVAHANPGMSYSKEDETKYNPEQWNRVKVKFSDKYRKGKNERATGPTQAKHSSCVGQA